MKLTIVQQIPKSKEQMQDSQTKRTTYKFCHRTVGTLNVSENELRLLKAQNAEAWENLRAALIALGHKKGIYNIREVLGGCKRFHRGRGMPKIGIVEI